MQPVKHEKYSVQCRCEPILPQVRKELAFSFNGSPLRVCCPSFESFYLYEVRLGCIIFGNLVRSLSWALQTIQWNAVPVDGEQDVYELVFSGTVTFAINRNELDVLQKKDYELEYAVIFVDTATDQIVKFESDVFESVGRKTAKLTPITV